MQTDINQIHTSKSQRNGVCVGKVNEAGHKDIASEVINPFKLHHLHQNVGRYEDLLSASVFVVCESNKNLKNPAKLRSSTAHHLELEGHTLNVAHMNTGIQAPIHVENKNTALY